MKIKYKKDGYTFSSIEQVAAYYCDRTGNLDEDILQCDKCPISRSNNQKNLYCDQFCRMFPAKAAILMGFEIVDGEDLDTEVDLREITLEQALNYCKSRDKCSGCILKEANICMHVVNCWNLSK